MSAADTKAVGIDRAGDAVVALLQDNADSLSSEKIDEIVVNLRADAVRPPGITGEPPDLEDPQYWEGWIDAYNFAADYVEQFPRNARMPTEEEIRDAITGAAWPNKSELAIVRDAFGNIIGTGRRGGGGGGGGGGGSGYSFSKNNQNGSVHVNVAADVSASATAYPGSDLVGWFKDGVQVTSNYLITLPRIGSGSYVAHFTP